MHVRKLVSIYCDQQSWQKEWLHIKDSKFVWVLKHIEHNAGVDDILTQEFENTDGSKRTWTSFNGFALYSNCSGSLLLTFVVQLLLLSSWKRSGSSKYVSQKSSPIRKNKLYWLIFQDRKKYSDPPITSLSYSLSLIDTVCLSKKKSLLNKLLILKWKKKRWDMDMAWSERSTFWDFILTGKVKEPDWCWHATAPMKLFYSVKTIENDTLRTWSHNRKDRIRIKNEYLSIISTWKEKVFNSIDAVEHRLLI